METRIVRKTTHASKGPEVTLQYTWDHKNSRVLRMPQETESKLKTWNFDPNSIRPDEDLQGQAVHAKKWQKEFQCQSRFQNN